jgi:hypothetical protein
MLPALELQMWHLPPTDDSKMIGAIFNVIEARIALLWLPSMKK